jgi:uncharacterized protein YcfJ
MKRLYCTLCLILALPAANAGERPVFRDWAEVIAVKQQTERYYVTVTRRQCGEDARAFANLPVAATLSGDIRRQQRLWASCREVTERQPRERVTGYRVIYRYRGHDAVRWLDYDPGRRLPVEVTLSTADD